MSRATASGGAIRFGVAGGNLPPVPGDPPVEQPSKFHLMFNLKTPKARTEQTRSDLGKEVIPVDVPDDLGPKAYDVFGDGAKS